MRHNRKWLIRMPNFSSRNNGYKRRASLPHFWHVCPMILGISWKTYAAKLFVGSERLAEKDVRFHSICITKAGISNNDLPDHLAEAEQRIWSTFKQLDQRFKNKRGLLEDTLVVLGRRIWTDQLCQGCLNGRNNYGRWITNAYFVFLCGWQEGGVKPGTVMGETDELGYILAKIRFSPSIDFQSQTLPT